MLRYFLGSVSRTLVLLILLATVPALLTIIFTGGLRQVETIEDARKRSWSIVRSISKQQEQIVQHVKNNFYLLAQLPEFQKLDLASCKTILTQLVNASSIYRDMMIYDPNGKLLMSAIDAVNMPDLSNRLSYKTALRFRSFAFGTIDIVKSPGRPNGVPVLYFAYPVLAPNGELKAIMAVAMQLGEYQRFIGEGLELSEGSHINLVDSSSKLMLSYPPYKDLSPGENVPPNIWAPLSLVAPEGQLIIRKDNEEDLLMTFQSLSLDTTPNFNLHVFLTFPQEPVYQKSKEELYAAFANFSVALLVTLFLVPVISYYILTRPTQKLIASVQAIGDGDFDTIVFVDVPIAEFQNLALGCNEIASALKNQDEALTTAKDLSEAASKAKSEFLANISHEIRTPMNAIIGMAHLCLKSNLDAKQYGYINKVYIAGNQLLRVINDILDFSKMEAGKLDIETIPFNLNTLIHSIISGKEDAAKKKGLTFTFNIDKSAPVFLLGDPLRLSQVIGNLIDNAIKFTSSGYVHLDVSPAGVYNQQATLVFEVTDSGVGMDQNQIDGLFAAFSQADNSSTRQFGGSGLGLAICKKILELMQGTITIRSVKGNGSTVICSAIFQVGKQNVMHLKSDQHLDLKVLVIDDDELSRQSIHEIVNSLHYVTHSVDNAAEGLHKISKADKANTPYDLVLLDWRMPNMDGIEMLNLIKNKLVLKKVPKVIMITAYGREDIRLRARRAGVDTFLHKPIDASVVNDVIASLFVKTSNDESDATPKLALADSYFTSSVPLDSSKGLETNNKILLVEDNDVNQQIATEIIESAGYQVVVANNGQEAIDILDKLYNDSQEFNVVLMDLQMPVLGGIEATKVLRSDSRFQYLPIVAMTASNLDKEKRLCQDVGMDGYVSKPFEIENLLSVLSIWRGGRRQVGVNKENIKQLVEQIVALLNQADAEGAALFKRSLYILKNYYPEDALDQILNHIVSIEYDEAVLKLNSMQN